MVYGSEPPVAPAARGRHAPGRPGLHPSRHPRRGQARRHGARLLAAARLGRPVPARRGRRRPARGPAGPQRAHRAAHRRRRARARARAILSGPSAPTARPIRRTSCSPSSTRTAGRRAPRKRRGDVHRDGDWHGALHIWVGGVDADGRPFALFQRRSRRRTPGRARSMSRSGGTFGPARRWPRQYARPRRRSGSCSTLADLTRLGRRFAHGVGRDDNEVQEVFALRSDLPLDAYLLHPDEVDAVVSVPLDDAIALFEGGVEAVRRSSSAGCRRLRAGGRRHRRQRLRRR